MRLLDENTAVCPRCWDAINTADLCEHDDPDTGPLCRDRCCRYWHDEFGDAA